MKQDTDDLSSFTMSSESGCSAFVYEQKSSYSSRNKPLTGSIKNSSRSELAELDKDIETMVPFTRHKNKPVHVQLSYDRRKPIVQTLDYPIPIVETEPQ